MALKRETKYTGLMLTIAVEKKMKNDPEDKVAKMFSKEVKVKIYRLMLSFRIPYLKLKNSENQKTVAK